MDFANERAVLGFLAKDDNAPLHLSPTGMGYLIDVVTGDISALPDAYAAAYTQGQTQSELPATGAIQKVLLMTPENIHLNSFMYEPILDISNEHLRKLHLDVLALS